MRGFRWWSQLRVRLLAGLAGVIIVSAFAIELTVDRTLRRELPQIELRGVEHHATRLRNALERAYEEHGTLSTKLLRQPPYVPLRIYRADGRLIEASSVMPPQHSAEAVQRALRNQPGSGMAQVDDQRFGFHVLPIHHDGTVIGAIEVAEELSPVTQVHEAIRHDLGMITIVGLSSVVAFCVFLGMRFGQALDEIKDQTTAIMGGNFERRIAITANDEIGQISAYLNQMAESLHNLTRTRTEFLSKVSHELRTPLTIAQGFSSMLRHGPLLPEQERTVGVIDDQLSELTRLVNDLLDLSRRQHGALDLRSEQIECRTLLAEVIEQQQPVLHNVRLRLKTSHRRGPALINGDRQRLHQIFGNLIGNASRYSRSEIRLELDSDAQAVIMRVCDDGPGIAPEDVSRIFEPFCQLNGPRGRAGLGLTIVRELVQAHGGTISVESIVGRGTCFSIHLPRLSSARPSLPPRTTRDALDDASYASGSSA